MPDLKEKLKDFNFKIAVFLTPVAYTEYVIKMLFILKPKSILKLFQVNMLLHIILLIGSLIVKPYLIDVKSLAISMVLSLVILGGFLAFRISKKNEDLDLVKSDLVLNPLDLKKIELPVVLKEFLNEEDKEEKTNEDT